MSKPRRPTTRESILALLTQSPIPIPASLVRTISTMASASVLRAMASASDPIDRQALLEAADLAGSPQAVPLPHQETPSEWTVLRDQAPTGPR